MHTPHTIKHLIKLTCLTLAVPLMVHAEPGPGPDAKPAPQATCKLAGHKEIGRGGERFGKQGLDVPPHLRNVGLSEAQRDKIFAITYAQLPVMRDQGKERRKTMEELRNLSEAPSFDDARAQQLAAKLADIEKQTVLARVRNEAKINAVLTPEQRQQIQDGRKRDEAERGLEPAGFKGPRPPAPEVNS